MYLLDYSLDNISLMGMTIAVGFVVDDAIVVVENVMRHLETGKSPLRAAIDGAREVSFTIVSMTVSLVAVFIPVLLMGGIIGRLFREFAVTVTVVILMSGIVSLTVTPMMCAWLIRHEPNEHHGKLYLWSERIFEAVSGFYERTLDRVLAHPVKMLLVTVATLLFSIFLYTVTPKGFFPLVDSGFISGTAQAAPDISFEAMSSRMQALGSIVSKDPDVENADYWIGNNPTMSQARIFINLKPRDQRRSTAAEVVDGIDLTGRRAIVTGGASGIGIETARALAGAGAEVTLAVRDVEAGQRTAAQITRSTGTRSTGTGTTGTTTN